MTYNAAESSLQNGAPVELYRFDIGPASYYFTSADEDAALSGLTYTAQPISRSSIEQTGEISKSGLRLTVARDFAIAELFRIAPPSDVVLLSVSRFHIGDNDPAVIWTGRVLNCDFSGHTATLNCESVYTSIKRTGLRRQYQRSCPHVLYGAPCGVSEAAYRASIQLSTVNGVTLTAAAFATKPDGYYSGGFIEYLRAAGQLERRAIKSHIGTTITITHQIVDMPFNATIAAFPGCDHTTATCAGKFANLDNYGGMPFIPVKNPFGGSSLF